MPPTPSLLSVAVLAALALTSPTRASAEEPRDLDRVQVVGKRAPALTVTSTSSATKTETPLLETPQAVTVLPRSLIDAQGGRSLNEVLGLAPGVGLGNGDGQRDQVTIRGFTAIADQYLDGVRDDALYFRDLANVERVEVLKGPSAMIFGRGSSGGLVNRVTKKPVDTPLARLRLTADTQGGARGEVDFGGPAGRGAYRLSGALEDSSTFREQGIVRRAFLAPSYRVDLGEGSLLFQASTLVDHRITDFGIPSLAGTRDRPARPVDVGIDTYYGSANARQDDYAFTRVHTINSIYSRPVGSDWSMRIALRGTDYVLGRRNTLVTGAPFVAANGRWMQNRRYGGVDRDQQAGFMQADFIREGQRHRLLVGAELGNEVKEQRTYAGRASAIDLLAPVLDRPQPGVLDGAMHSQFDNVGVYLQDQVTLTPRVKAVIGTRFDAYRQRSATRFGAPASFQRTDREWSPRAGLIWMPTPEQSLYANWGRSFQPSGEVFPLSSAIADLQPEVTENHEVGYKYADADGRWTFDIAAFDTQRDHIKTTDPTDARRQISVGTQQTRGVELGLAASLLARRLDLYAGYAYLDAEITRSNNVIVYGTQRIPLQGNTPSLTPRHSASLFGEFDIGAGWHIGGLAQYVGLRYAAPTNVTILPAYTRYDAHVRYAAGPLQVRVRLENLFDKRYFVSAHGGSDGFSTPGAPRTLSITMDCAF